MTAPPLDMSFSELPTKFQLVTNGMYELRIDKAEVKVTAKGGKMIHLELSTVAPATSRLSEPLAPGVKLFHNQNITPSGKATWDIILKGPSGLGALFQSALGKDGAKAINLQNVETVGVPMLTGRVLTASVGWEDKGISPAGKPYPEKNVINYWMVKNS